MHLSLKRLNLDDRPATAAAGEARARLTAAAGAAIVAHAMVLALALQWAVPALVPPAAPPGFMLLVTAPSASPSPAAIPQRPPSPMQPALASVPVPMRPPPDSAAAHAPDIARAATPEPRHRPTRGHAPRVAPQAAGASISKATPNATPAPPPSGNAAPIHLAGAPAALDVATLDGFRQQIDTAVRQAAIMPEAARRQRRQGRARVAFSYIDGAVQAVQVVQSSQSRILDDAAVRAVQQAHYPSPPANIRGRKLALLVWIDFQLAPSG